MSPERIRQIGYDLGTYLAWRACHDEKRASFDTLEACDRYAGELGADIILKGRRLVGRFPGILPSRARYAP